MIDPTRNEDLARDYSSSLCDDLTDELDDPSQLSLFGTLFHKMGLVQSLRMLV